MTSPCFSIWLMDFLLAGLQDRVVVNGAHFKISNLALEDSGMYQCVAENKHGTIYSSAELRVQGKRSPTPPLIQLWSKLF